MVVEFAFLGGLRSLLLFLCLWDFKVEFLINLILVHELEKVFENESFTFQCQDSIESFQINNCLCKNV